MKIDRELLPFIFTHSGLSSPLWKYGLVERCKSLEELYLSIEKLFPEARRKDIIESSEKSYKETLKNNVQIINYYDNNYPTLLKEIYNPPISLFYKGKIELLQKDLIGVVGTRKPSGISKAACSLLPNFIKKFQNSGVVSGLAIGIDKEAMLACLRNSIPVVGVMGTGFDKIYPPQNKDLYNLMYSGKESLILTEMRWGETVGKWSFPRRNRIITGLCKALFVMEAPKESGAMSSATHAISQNREVTVFNHPEMLNNEGGRKLISEGAHELNMDDLENGNKKIIHVSELFPKDYNHVHEYISFISNLEMKGVLKDRGSGYYEMKNSDTSK